MWVPRREVTTMDTNTTAALRRAYKMGFDSVVNGCNTENCNFTLFATKESKDAWERGRDDALKSAKGR